MKHNNKQVGSVSKTGTTRTDFEFPTGVLTELPNDVVLFGKVITRKTEPQTRKENAVAPGIRSPSGKESRCRRSGTTPNQTTKMSSESNIDEQEMTIEKDDVTHYWQESTQKQTLYQSTNMN
ncbi:hypothetical protein RYX36_008961 [Vicia faba]